LSLTHHQEVEREGIKVALTIEALDPGRGATGLLREGDDVVVRFRIGDAAKGAPLRGVHPAAWLTAREPGAAPDAKLCASKVQTLLSGSLFTAPELNLNVYHLIAMNEDATLTVVDPLLGFGGSKLLALVPLAAVAEDWALTLDQTRLFVALPDADRLAVVSTSTWKVETNVPAGPRPTRLALQPDGHYLWVGHDPAGPGASVITVVDAGGAGVAATIAVGAGPHEFAFDPDSRSAFVADAGAGTVSVVDVQALRVAGRIATGPRPSSIAYSPMAGMVYLTDPAEGTITAIDAKRHRLAARIKAEPGLGPIAFAPGSALGFILNPERGTLHILDAASNRLIQRAVLREGPDQLMFSDNLAYIRHRGTEEVMMVPLAEVGKEGKPVPAFHFPAGQNPLGRTSRPSPAGALVQAPGESAVLVANPADKAVYYYKEGMAAPMGHFNNYGHQPRAVLVVDRSLQERDEPGVYQTIARLRKPGTFDLAFFLDSPRFVHCFPIEVQPDPVLAQQRNEAKVDVEVQVEQDVVTAGQAARLHFRFLDPGSRSPRTGLRDVSVLAFAPGGWQSRELAREEPQRGLYAFEFRPPRPGSYFVNVSCRSLGLRPKDSPRIVVSVQPAEGSTGRVTEDPRKEPAHD
jgi:YVTN family beta-propeller protein